MGYCDGMQWSLSEMVWHCTGEEYALREFMEYHGRMQWRLSEMVWHCAGKILL